MKKENVLLLLILFVAAFLRFWQLGIVPGGVTNDEMGYIYNAYAISQTGRNVFGEFLPFLTWVNSGGWPFLPVPIYLTAPFFWLFDLSATTGRLPSAILGTLDVLLLFVLMRQIFKNTQLALLSAFFLTISPWHLHFSRSAYDPNYALFFYLLGIVAFIWEIRKGRLPLVSLLAFLLAIFSYRGMNVIFLPLVGLLGWYGIKVLKVKKRQLYTFAFGVVAIIFALLLVLGFAGKRYVAETMSLTDPKISEDIDKEIREAQGPLFVRRLFLNKPMYRVNKLRENYMRAYSPEFLFLYTEPSNIYSIWSRGRIYALDSIFILLGIAYLYTLSKKGAMFVTILLLIAGLPGMLGGFPYSARNFFLSSLLPIFSAGGILFLTEKAWIKKVKPLLIILLVIAYGYLLGSYLFDYYGRYAYYGSEAWAKSLREVSMLIVQDGKQYNKIIVGKTSFGDFLQYAFYAKLPVSDVQHAKLGSFYALNNVTFIPDCISDAKKSPVYNGEKPLLYITHDECHPQATPSSRITDYHGNTIWKIYKLYDK